MSDYDIVEMGENRIELRSTLLFGLSKGFEDIVKQGYKISHNSVATIGNMYVIPATKPKISQEFKNQFEMEKIGLQEQIEELQENIKSMQIENRTLKATLTKAKTKIGKLES